MRETHWARQVTDWVNESRGLRDRCPKVSDTWKSNIVKKGVSFVIRIKENLAKKAINDGVMQ
jgi:hypothetical protein